MVDKRINNSDKSYSVDACTDSRSHDQDGCHAHIWLKPQPLCPATVLGDSKVIDHCRFHEFLNNTEVLKRKLHHTIQKLLPIIENLCLEERHLNYYFFITISVGHLVLIFVQE